MRLWGTSFDSLLFDKRKSQYLSTCIHIYNYTTKHITSQFTLVGRHLFRQFVNCEYSSENLDFYEDVEEFKKLKPGKKTTVQRGNDIFNTYFKEGAKKEVILFIST